MKKNHPWKERGQGHVSNFYILDLENFATANRRCIGVVNKLVDGQVVDYTCTTVKRVVTECTVYYTLVDCNPLTLSIRSVLDLS